MHLCQPLFGGVSCKLGACSEVKVGSVDVVLVVNGGWELLALLLDAATSLQPVEANLHPSQVQSLNFILLTIADSGLAVTRHTQHGG